MSVHSRFYNGFTTVLQRYYNVRSVNKSFSKIFVRLNNRSVKYILGEISVKCSSTKYQHASHISGSVDLSSHIFIADA